MGIIGNKTLLHKLPLTQVGGAFATDIATNPNWHVKEDAKLTASVPNGYYAGGAWVLPQTSGEIANINGILGKNLLASNLAGGLNAESFIEGTGDITNSDLLGLSFLISSLNQTSNLNASIAGSVNVSATLASSGNLNGALGALIGIVATLNGEGELSSSIAGAVQAIANLVQSGDVSAAIKATVNLIATTNGNNTLTSDIIGNWNMVTSIISSNNFSAAIKAFAEISSNPQGNNAFAINNGAVVGSMSSQITSLNELSPESLASSVWSALASQYDQAGTMGEKMNGAGSAGNPWTEIIEGTYSAAEVMRILVSVASGKSTIVDNGNNSATVIFRDLDDTQDRITAQMNGSERTTVTLNP